MEARFTGPLVIEEIGYELWKIVTPFDFVDTDGTVINVPKGFVTDLASVPPIARSIVSKIGYWSQAAVAHDIGYAYHRAGKNTEWTRKQVDKWFLHGIVVKEKEYGIPKDQSKANLLYAGVRMGGLASWETEEERQERVNRNNQWNFDLYE